MQVNRPFLKHTKSCPCRWFIRYAVIWCRYLNWSWDFGLLAWEARQQNTQVRTILVFSWDVFSAPQTVRPSHSSYANLQNKTVRIILANTCPKCHIIINCATLYLCSTTIFFTQYPIRIAFINIALYSNNQIVVFSKSMLYVTIGNVLSGFCLQQNFTKNLNVRLAMHTTRTFQLYSYLLVRVSAGPNVLKSVLYNATSRLLRHKPFARFSGKKSAATYRGCWSLIVQLS